MQPAIVHALFALLAGANLELEASVRSETRAGITPALGCDDPNDTYCKLQPSYPVWDLEVAPLAGVTVLWPTVAAALRYSPMVILRRCIPGDSSCSVPDDLKKPLLLHQVELALARRAGQLNYTLLASGAYGQSSFADLRVTNARVPVPVLGSSLVHTTNAFLIGRMNDRFSQHQEWAIDAQADYSAYTQDPIGASAICPTGNTPGARQQQCAFPGQELATVTPSYIYHPDRDNDVELAAVGGVLVYTNVDNMGGYDSFPTIEPRVGYRHRFGTRTQLSLRAGLVFLLDSSNRIPSGDASLSVIAYRGGGDNLTVTLSGGVSAYASPLEAELLGFSTQDVLVPRASLELDLIFTSHRNFTASLSASMYSSLSEPQLSARVPLREFPPDLSIVMLTVPLTYRFAETFEIGGGFRGSARSDTDLSHVFGGAANDPRPKSFQWLQLEAMGYLGLTVRFGRGLDSRPRDAGRY